MKMAHSGLYLQVDGDQIVQVEGSKSEERQYWKMAGDPVRLVTENRTPAVSGNVLTIADGIRKIDVPGENASVHVKLTITDIRGRVVCRKSSTAAGAAGISTDTFARGLYVAHLQYGDRVVHTAFLVK